MFPELISGYFKNINTAIVIIHGKNEPAPPSSKINRMASQSGKCTSGIGKRNSFHALSDASLEGGSWCGSFLFGYHSLK